MAKAFRGDGKKTLTHTVTLHLTDAEAEVIHAVFACTSPVEMQKLLFERAHGRVANVIREQQIDGDVMSDPMMTVFRALDKVVA